MADQNGLQQEVEKLRAEVDEAKGGEQAMRKIAIGAKERAEQAEAERDLLRKVVRRIEALRDRSAEAGDPQVTRLAYLLSRELYGVGEE